VRYEEAARMIGDEVIRRFDLATPAKVAMSTISQAVF
jgi:hypothetical protein